MPGGTSTIFLGFLSVAINAGLMVIKITAGVIGNSYALIADGIESAGDIITSIITWCGFHIALRPPDKEHPFGHGKIESLAGIVSGLALLGAGVFIGWQAIREIQTPQRSPAWFTLPILIGTVIVKFALSRRIMSVGRDMHSRALEGDAWHHVSDAVTSGVAAVAISITLIGGPAFAKADGIGALVACVFIEFNGLRTCKRAFDDMMDGAVPPAIEEQVRSLAITIQGVRAIEKCRIRKSGLDFFVEIHVVVDGGMTVREGHDLGHRVKERLMELMPNVLDVVPHIEPEEELSAAEVKEA